MDRKHHTRNTGMRGNYRLRPLHPVDNALKQILLGDLQNFKDSKKNKGPSN